MAALAENDFVYREFRQEALRLNRRGSPECIRMIERAARVAWEHHPGRFADGALENPLLRWGRLIQVASTSASVVSSKPFGMTLHVATEVYPTGGHSRVLTKWVSRDATSDHLIVLTRQNAAVPDFLRVIWRQFASVVELDPALTPLARATQLRQLSQSADRIILHHHPDDAVPILAFAAEEGCPVAMFNHAHFWFSLGTSVADMVINTIPYFARISERHRYAKRIALLEGPPGLERYQCRAIDKQHAKRVIGIHPTMCVALSIGAEHYFAPTGGESIFKAIEELLVARHSLHFIFAGISQASKVIPASLRKNPRVQFLGRVENPMPYYLAADLCLESFPMPSLGAVLEAVGWGGAFPVLAYADHENIMRITQVLLEQHVRRTRTQAEYVSHVCHLTDHLEEVRAHAEELRRLIVRADQTFGQQFPPMYAQLANHPHKPRCFPETGCCMEEDNQLLAAHTQASAFTKLSELGSPVTSCRAHFRAVKEGLETMLDVAKLAVDRILKSTYLSGPKAWSKSFVRSFSRR